MRTTSKIDAAQCGICSEQKIVTYSKEDYQTPRMRAYEKFPPQLNHIPVIRQVGFSFGSSVSISHTNKLYSHRRKLFNLSESLPRSLEIMSMEVLNYRCEVHHIHG